MNAQDDLIQQFKAKVSALKQALEPLEAGNSRTGQQLPGGTWTDTTQQQIELLRQSILELETLVSQYEGQYNKPGR